MPRRRRTTCPQALILCHFLPLSDYTFPPGGAVLPEYLPNPGDEIISFYELDLIFVKAGDGFSRRVHVIMLQKGTLATMNGTYPPLRSVSQARGSLAL
ncbi:hypothetical protein LshimejAT787_1801670 [Lyophyllum shimeji]|uniref:Uncharacterized protein n=1 Tax=Lyophyllum shimeji TaxID=47721 RepID=A0A9P3UUK0_LYOSH|nr:hypothetical protein LshimejAT787_1801670 [Lyophyllum shimeji]